MLMGPWPHWGYTEWVLTGSGCLQEKPISVLSAFMEGFWVSFAEVLEGALAALWFCTVSKMSRIGSIRYYFEVVHVCNLLLL